MLFELEASDLNVNKYWQAVWLFINRPNVVNRKLLCHNQVCALQVADGYESMSIERMSAILNVNYMEQIQNFDFLKLVEYHQAMRLDDRSYLLIRKLLFKNKMIKQHFELCFLDYTKMKANFYEYAVDAACSQMCGWFEIEKRDTRIAINADNECQKNGWLEYCLLPKLVRWAERSENMSTFVENSTGSLRLVSNDSYAELYSHFKNKYGKPIVDIWPEVTDPSKFVYEDLAIATYLCLLWSSDKKLKFVDLGCGNGLLVYVLNSEGYSGIGIDVRERKIWHHYPSHRECLKVGTVTEDSHSEFPDADWIIGNHSDELTPWIPLFAARSSYNCKFFLLPCCAYKFDGRRYQRKNSSISLYADYVHYISELCCEMGFEIQTDKLRIPSTKRLCIIGYARNYPEVLHSVDYTNGKIGKHLEKQLVLRESRQEVRNCTQIDRTICANIVNTIGDTLISRQKKHNCDWSTDNDSYGISFEEAAANVNKNELKTLKKECGGLQTLLRNHKHIFRISTNGLISFRRPQPTVKQQKLRWKQKDCWFYHRHPLSCPLGADECSFKHAETTS